MKKKNKIINISLVFTFFLIIFTGVIVFSQEKQDKPDDTTQIRDEFRERIRNSDGVCIQVEVTAQDESDKKSFTDELQNELKNQLKNAKITILSKDESDNMQGKPRLELFLITYKDPSQKNVFLYSFRLVHYEVASLLRSNKYVEGICWDSGLYIGMERRTAIKNAVREQVTKYIEDYITANPIYR